MEIKTVVTAVLLVVGNMVCGVAVGDWAVPVNQWELNTPYTEMSPALSAWGDSIFVGSARPGGSGGVDVWSAGWTGSAWSEPQNLGPQFNSNDLDAVSCVSPGGGLVYLSSARAEALGGRDVFKSIRSGGEWGEPFAFGWGINTVYEDAAPCATANGRVMYFASERPGTYGGNDIWRTERTPWGWTEPENVYELNSAWDERHPCISFDGAHIIFTSTRPGTMGGQDLWSSHRTGSGWGAPFNLGSPVNTTADDNCATRTLRGRTMALASNRAGGMGDQDIYMTEWQPPISVTISPDTTTVVQGDTLHWSLTLTNNTGEYREFESWKVVIGKNLEYVAETSDTFELGPGETLEVFEEAKVPLPKGFYIIANKVGTYPWLSSGLDLFILRVENPTVAGR